MRRRVVGGAERERAGCTAEGLEVALEVLDANREGANDLVEGRDHLVLVRDSNLELDGPFVHVRTTLAQDRRRASGSVAGAVGW